MLALDDSIACSFDTSVALNQRSFIHGPNPTKLVKNEATPIMSSIPAGIQASLESTKVSYERVGKSGLFVSNPILGAMSIGSTEWADWVLNEDEV